MFAIITMFSVSVLVAHAFVDSNSYGITLSQGCKTNLKNNLTTTCPTYEEIMVLFPDTSDRKIIGDFGMKNGIFQRLTSNYKNAEGYYTLGREATMFIDPPVKLWNKLKIIEIRPNLDEYKLPKNKSYNTTEHSLTLGFGRYIDSCRTAYVDSKDWIFLVGDSINLINNKCDPEFTQFNGTRTTYFQKITHDITTSYKYKLEKWIKESIINCGGKVCFYEKNQTKTP